MRKNNKIIIMVFAIIIALMILIPKVQAKTINTLNVTESNGKINVSGTTEDGALAVAIMVYDSTGATLVTMQTTSVGSDNSYSDTITIADGTYVVKVADYEGGEYITKTVSSNIENSEETNDPTNTEKPEETDDPINTTKPEETNKTENTIDEPTNTIISEEKLEAGSTDTVDSNSSSNPKTGDNIIVFAVIFVLALTGLAVTVIINKKRVKNSK